MRLHEITFPKTIDDADRILRDHGYTRIGQGGYGRAYRKPDEQFVLKLYGREDHAFTAFVDFCRSQPNVHFPRFSKASIAIPNTKYFAVRSELLTAAPRDTYTDLWPFLIALKFNTPKYPAELNILAKRNPSLAEAFSLLVDRFGKDGSVHLDVDNPSNMMMRGDTVVISDPLTPTTR